MEQARGIEPPFPAWEAGVLPMNHACIYMVRPISVARSCVPDVDPPAPDVVHTFLQKLSSQFFSKKACSDLHNIEFARISLFCRMKEFASFTISSRGVTYLPLFHRIFPSSVISYATNLYLFTPTFKARSTMTFRSILFCVSTKILDKHLRTEVS